MSHELTIKDAVKAMLESRRVRGVITAYGVSNGDARKLQAMKFHSVDNRRAAMRKLLATWKTSVVFFQIVTRRG